MFVYVHRILDVIARPLFNTNKATRFNNFNFDTFKLDNSALFAIALLFHVSVGFLPLITPPSI